MKRFLRATGLAAVAALSVALMPAAGSAAPGNETKNERGAQTQQRATDVFIDVVPCADDAGFFEITLSYNSAERITDKRGHFTQNGTFSAVPITVTRFEEEEHDDHTHLIPVEGVARDGASYSGRFTTSGTMNNNPNATTQTFNFRVDGTSSAGEKVSARALFHQITSNGETRSLIERETCG